MFASTSRLNSNITRARRWGFTAAQAICAVTAACTAASRSAALASGARVATSPVFGSKTSLKRPDDPAKTAPFTKCWISDIGFIPLLADG